MGSGMSVDQRADGALREADARLAAGDVVGAIAGLRQVVSAEPGHFTAWMRLSRLLFGERAFAEAVDAGRAAEQADPLQAEFQTIQRAMQQRRFDQARQVAEGMLRQYPGHPRAAFTLAHLARARGDSEACMALLDTALEHSPANLTLRNILVFALEDCGAYARALEAARQIVEIEERFEAVMTLATLLLRYGQNEELLAACDRAEALSGGHSLRISDVDLVRGQALRILGRREDSVAAFRRCLQNNPRNGDAAWALADLKTHDFSGEDQNAITAILADPRSDRQQQCVASFALAKASEANGDWDATMALYHRANQLKPDVPFNPDAFEQAVDRMIAEMTPDALSAQAEDVAGPTPIFIIGLPRSGSTLVEQILASHSQIEATMEQPVLPSVKRAAHRLCAERYGSDYLAALGRLSVSDLSGLGDRYIRESALFRREGAAFFTDKMPFNFEHVGLIHKILPRAVVIDIRRNPLDCGFSLYRQYFAQGTSFSYDLGHIGRYYNGYLKLMDHWQSVLPGRVLPVQFEELVADPEGAIRRMLDHVGVPFEAACLNFHETDRAVRTASSEQVRQPMNTKGIGAWKKVETHLQPLKAALGPDTLERFRAFLGE
jgi:tetratricopeptide (TPR) repeat protein